MDHRHGLAAAADGDLIVKRSNWIFDPRPAVLRLLLFTAAVNRGCNPDDCNYAEYESVLVLPTADRADQVDQKTRLTGHSDL